MRLRTRWCAFTTRQVAETRGMSLITYEAPIISQEFAEIFRLTKAELVVPVDDRCEITQSGGAYLDPLSNMPPRPVLPAVDEAVIETFVADPAGAVIQDPARGLMRNLLVLRAKTVPR